MDIGEAQFVLPSSDATAGGAQTEKNNKWTCPSKYTNDFDGTNKKMSDNVLAMESSRSWWCSDGTFLMKADTTNHGSGSTDQSFIGAIADFAAGQAAKLNVKAANDRRLELYY